MFFQMDCRKAGRLRYVQMREEWGDRVQLWFFLFYQVQAFAA